MGENFYINKSGKSFDELAKMHVVPEAITTAEDSAKFEANYKEPEFTVADGHIQGGDLAAKAVLDKLLSKVVAKEEEEQAAVEPTVETAGAAIEPCC